MSGELPVTGKRSFFASVGALSAARAAAMASQLLVLPILARYLSPAEFGIVALAMSVAVLANMLSDGGMGRSLIRTPLEKYDEWSTVFWCLTALGLGLFLGLLALAPAMVWLFEEPALFWPLAVLTPIPFILALSAAFAAEMEQRDAFGELALAQTAATFAGLGAAVWMAIEGYGVWALIAQQILLQGVRAAWVILRSRFRPGLMFSRTALAPHFTFGRDTIAASLLTYLREQSTPLVIGKMLGVADLGIYAMTARFMRLPMFALAGPFGQVLYVRLTRAQHDMEDFRGILLAALRLLAFAILPPMAALAVTAETVFVLVLSETWAPVAPVFALIACGAALIAITNPVAIALSALGQTMARLRLTLEATLFWLILLATSVSFGLAAVAAARSLWMLLLLPRNQIYLNRACGVTARSFALAFLPGGLTAVAVMLTIIGADAASSLSGWAWVGLVALLSTLVFGFAALLCKATLLKDLSRLRG